MSFVNSNDFIGGRKPMIYPAGSELVAVRFPIAITTADLALNTLGQVGVLPAGCVPVSCHIDSDALDSNGTPLLTLSVGLLNAAGTDLSTDPNDGGGAWGSGITIARAGGVAPSLNAAIARVNEMQVDRKLMVKVTAAAATAVAGALGVTLVYHTSY